MSAPPASTVLELDAFIRTAKSAGVPDAALVELLKQNGWSERRIFRSLSGYYFQVLGVAPPSRSAHSESARDAFLYLLNFITLSSWTVALGNLCYVLIARAFPDPTNLGYRPYGPGSPTDQIAWQLASIIVTLPVFAFINRVIARELRRRPDLIDSAVRLWLTYLALVIAATIVIADGIWFLDALLRGGITVRFVLDSLVLLILGGGVFAYYFAGLQPSATNQ